MNDLHKASGAEEESFSDQYGRLRGITEKALNEYLPKPDPRSGLLYDAMKYSLDAGGKRLRPVLLLASCQAVQGSISDALPFACAIEYIHTYSLIHDDHPSMDNDDLRRGKPTNHKVFGDDMAILAGDGLLNSAMDVMLAAVMAEGDPEKKERKLAAACEISKAAGTGGMVAGQTADVLATGGRLARRIDLAEEEKPEFLRYIHRNKTGALIRAAVRAGALVGGAHGQELGALTEYAEKVGLVFQIVDDILDVVGDEQTLGKKTGMDAALGKMTYPSVFGLEQSYDFARQYTQEAEGAMEPLGNHGMFLVKLALDLQKRIS
ncbi:MAG: polyprenyl synthetase family protein [Anaerovoracaceae bacterium]